MLQGKCRTQDQNRIEFGMLSLNITLERDVYG